MKHTISILVKNEAGVISRISDVFSGRGYNMESITAAPTIDTDYSRVTIVTMGDAKVIEQIVKQLNRLIPTLKIMELSSTDAIEVELVLCKVSAKDEDRSEILRIAEIFNAKIVDVSPKSYTIQAIGDDRQMTSLLELLRPIGIKELVRSGKVAISRENQFQNIKNL